MKVKYITTNNTIRISFADIARRIHPRAEKVSPQELAALTSARSSKRKIELHLTKPKSFSRNLDQLCVDLACREEQSSSLECSQLIRQRVGKLRTDLYQFFDDLFTYKGPIDSGDKEWQKPVLWLQSVFDPRSIKKQDFDKKILTSLRESISQNPYSTKSKFIPKKFGTGPLAEARVALALSILKARGVIKGFYFYNTDKQNEYQIFNAKGIRFSKLYQGTTEDALGVDFMIVTEKGLIPMQVKAGRNQSSSLISVKFKGQNIQAYRDIPILTHVKDLRLEEIISGICELLINNHEKAMPIDLKTQMQMNYNKPEHLESLTRELFRNKFLISSGKVNQTTAV